jgi:hypothetical protein
MARNLFFQSREVAQIRACVRKRKGKQGMTGSLFFQSEFHSGFRFGGGMLNIPEQSQFSISKYAN